MPKQLVTHAITKFLGQDSASNRDALLPGKGRLVYNYFTEHNILKKIPGTELYINSVIGTDPVRYLSIFQFKWIYQIGTNLVTETAEGSKVESLIDFSFDKARIFSDEWRGNLYLANGVQLKYFDGTTLSDLGIYPPGNGKTPRRSIPVPGSIALGGSDGFTVGFSGILPAGVYSYTFTYYDPLTNTESLPFGSLVGANGLFTTSAFDSLNNPNGWISFAVNLNSTKSINLILGQTNMNLLFGDRPARATQLNLYRKDPGASSFKFVTSFNPATPINFTDNNASSTLGATLIPDQIAPPPTATGAINSGAATSTGPTFIRFWRDSLWLLGCVFPKFTVTDSSQGSTQTNPASTSILYASDTFLPDYYPFNYEIGRNDGQLPTGLAVANDTLIVLKQRSTYLILGDNLNNFVLKIIDPVRGCIAAGSIQETPLGVIFLAEDGLCVCDATGPGVRISKEIDDEIKSINLNAASKICSYYDRYKSRYKMFFPTGTSTENNRFIEFDLIDKNFSVGSAYNATAVKFGMSSGLVPKIVAGKFGGRLIDIYNRNNPADDGQTIYAIWRSDDFDFGNRGKRKRLTWLHLHAACSTNFVVDIRVYSDYGQGPIYELLNFNSLTYWAQYGSSSSDSASAVYNSDYYGDAQTFIPIKIPIQGVGRIFYLEIVEHQNNSQNVLFDIHSIELEGTILSK